MVTVLASHRWHRFLPGDPLDLARRVRGGAWGLLVGDALGVPYEFHDPEGLPDRVEMQPPPGFARAHSGTPPGTWSDDGAQALALLDSLLTCGELDPEDLARRLLDWERNGAYAVDGRVFDVGGQTGNALRRLARGVPPLLAGGDDERSNGNGALMRVLPLAVWHRGSDEQLVTDAFDQSRVTHGHARSQVCCAVYVLVARGVLQGAADPWASALAALRRDGRHAVEVARVVQHRQPAGGSGYVLDTLQGAREALAARTYEQVVRRAISWGHDTDTTACVAGGLAGLRDGIDAIPHRWLAALRGRDLAEPLVGRLVAHVLAPVDLARVARIVRRRRLRVLVSNCLLGRPVAWDGTDQSDALVQRLAACPAVEVVGFCPEHQAFGTPRPLSVIHGGDGHDVLDGIARVRTPAGDDWTSGAVAAAHATLAQAENADLAVLMDVSPACGSRVVRRGETGGHRLGDGVTAALLRRRGIQVLAQRDHRTLAHLLAMVEPGYAPDPAAVDHVETPWVREHLGVV